METPQKKNFVSLLKDYSGTIAAILSFVALVLSTTQSLSADLTFGAIALLAVATLILLTYNIWLVKVSQRHERVYTQRRQRLAQFSRWAVHTASVLLLILSWSVVGILASDKYSGYLFFRLGRFERATAQLSSYVAASKSDINAQMKLAECFYELNDHVASLRTLEQLIENERAFKTLDSDKRNILLGTIYYKFGSRLLVDDFTRGLEPQYDRALQYLTAARLYDPYNIHVLFLLGFAKANHEPEAPSTKIRVREIFNEAKHYIDLALKGRNRDTTLIQYHYYYGRSLTELHLHDKAQAELEAALRLQTTRAGKSDESFTDYILLQLGRNEYLRSNDLSTATEHWERMTDKEASARALTLTGSAMLSQGKEAAKMGDQELASEAYAKAQQLLSEAVRMGERSILVLRELGTVYFLRQDYRQAAATFQKLTNDRPSDQLGYFMLGRSKFFIENGMKEAYAAMGKAIELDPEDALSHYWMGRIAAKLGKLEYGKTEFNRSIELSPSRMVSYYYLVETLGLLANEAEPNSDRKIDLLEEALQRIRDGLAVAEPDKEFLSKLLRLIQEQIWNSLAYSYLQRGENFKLAMSYIDSALERSPENPHYLDTRAWGLIRLAEQAEASASAKPDLDHAEDLLKRALALLPEEDTKGRAETLFHLGYLHKARGKQADARKFFLKALEYDPGHSDAKAGLQ